MMENGFRQDRITYEKVKRIGTAGKKEINLVSWNGHRAKVDIREWDGDIPRKGITLTEAEAEALYKALKGRYESEGKNTTEGD